MDFFEKVGNIKVYIEKKAEKSIKVTFINGTDVVLTGVYLTDKETTAIEALFRELDTYTEEWLCLHYPGRCLEKMEEGLYKSGKQYFKRVDDTRFFKHFDHLPLNRIYQSAERLVIKA